MFRFPRGIPPFSSLHISLSAWSFHQASISEWGQCQHEIPPWPFWRQTVPSISPGRLLIRCKTFLPGALCHGIPLLNRGIGRNFPWSFQEGWQLKEGRCHKECRTSQVSAVAGVALHFPGAARRLALLAGTGFGGALSVAPPGKIRQNESVCSKGRACG